MLANESLLSCVDGFFLFFFLNKLVSGLGDEKIRWAENVKQLEFLISNVIGDVLVASGFIAYLGPFIVI